MYKDDYPTCEQTYLSLRIFHDSATAQELTDTLKVSPTDSKEAGHGKPTYWTVSTEGAVDSLDLRKHLDWLLDKLEPCKAALKEIQKNAKVDIPCYWRSRNGHGGPTLSVEQIKRLADFELEIWFDFYYLGQESHPVA